MSKEVLNKQVGEWRKEVARLKDLIAHATGTEVAANKATEEGELPMDAESRMLRAGKNMFDTAKRWGWLDDGEGAFEFITRRSYEQGQLDTEADRASRHVASVPDAFANKAEVEPFAFAVRKPEDGHLFGIYTEIKEARSVAAQWGGTIVSLWETSTPPATTGASTVLTDERIIEDARDWGLLDIQDGGRIDRSALIGFVLEVAAQAGQVAVPGWISIEECLPDSGYCLATYRNQHGKLRIIRAKYARQFEIDAGEDAIDQGNCEYNEADDTFYLKAGWLECIDNWDDYSSIYVTEGEVTHWMPLPATPSPAKESK